MIDCDNIITASQAAAKLIEEYCDNIYGTVPYLVKSLIALMDFQLTADPHCFD